MQNKQLSDDRMDNFAALKAGKKDLPAQGRSTHSRSIFGDEIEMRDRTLALTCFPRGQTLYGFACEGTTINVLFYTAKRLREREKRFP